MLRNAKRFFRKTLKALHASSPRVITVDKNAAYPKAINSLKEKKALHKKVKLRQKKYLNNIVEQDHRGIKRLVKPGMGFGSFNTARRTIKGYEAMNMIRKGQTSWSCQRSHQRTGSLHAPNLWSSCIANSRILGVFCPKLVFATQPNWESQANVPAVDHTIWLAPAIVVVGKLRRASNAGLKYFVDESNQHSLEL